MGERGRTEGDELERQKEVALNFKKLTLNNTENVFPVARAHLKRA